MAIDAPASPSASHHEATGLSGALVFSGTQSEIISGGRKISVATPHYHLDLDQEGVGSFSLTFDDGNTSWTASFSTPDSQPFQTTRYAKAGRWAMVDQGKPGMEISGDGRGCNDLHGTFSVTEISYDGSGNLTRFRATFSQYGDDESTPVSGTIFFQAGRVKP